MKLGFTAAVRAFAAFSFATTLSNAQQPVKKLVDETAIGTCVVNNVNNFKPIHEWDLEFEGYSSQGEHQMPSSGRDVYCGHQKADGKHKSEDQDAIDRKVEHDGLRKIINALYPAVNRLDKVKMQQFLNDFDHTFMDRSKPKEGPNYFVIDNFARYFKLNDADLLGAKEEVIKLSDFACENQ